MTIHDVARRAGVSITTVSHALNGKGVVKDSTRQHVIDIAAELGYSADAIARSLRSSRLGVLGLVIRPLDTLDSYSPAGVDYFVRFAGAAAVKALDRGFGLMLVRDPTTPNVPGVAMAVDGYIIADPVARDPVIDLLNRHAIPLVTVGRDIERPSFTDWVGSTSTADTLAVITHLRERGARRIALLTGTDANAWNHDSEIAYRNWAREHGQEPLVSHCDETLGEEGGREFARTLVDASGPRADAVYCLTGRHAAGLAAGLQHAGFSVPQDVMIVAGSDSEQTRRSAPPITSVDLAPEATARAAVDFLISRLDGDTSRQLPQIERTLLVRGSTARAAREEESAARTGTVRT